MSIEAGCGGERRPDGRLASRRREHERHRHVVAILAVDLGAPTMNAFNDEADTSVETSTSLCGSPRRFERSGEHHGLNGRFNRQGGLTQRLFASARA
jgi:hypothetical protein